MIVVLFKNSKDNVCEIGKAKDEKEAFSIVNNFLKEHKFKSYYTRITVLEDGSKWLDVGSHTEFFYFVKEENLVKYISEDK